MPVEDVPDPDALAEVLLATAAARTETVNGATALLPILSCTEAFMV